MKQLRSRARKREIDLTNAGHRAMVLRAQHGLLSQGKTEEEAKRGALALALQRWQAGEDRPG